MTGDPASDGTAAQGEADTHVRTISVDGDDRVVEGGDGPPDVAYDERAFPPLAGAPAVGDPGHQGAVIATAGPLTPGVPDTVVDFLTAEPFELRAVSTRGWSHRHLGTPRQDACAADVSDEWVAFAVADGVSEGASSHVAAETAARVAVRLAIRSAPDVDWEMLAARVSMRIAEEGAHRGIVPQRAEGEDTGGYLRTVRSEAATTLVVAVMARRATWGEDEFREHVGHIAVIAGDSGAYVVKGGVIAPAAGGKDADAAIASTSVRPLPGFSSPEVTTVSLGPGEALLLVSDGIGDPLGDADNDLGAELSARLATPPTADALVRDVNFLRRSYDDDRTLVGVWVLPEVGPSQVGASPEAASRHDPTAGTGEEPAPESEVEVEAGES